MRRGENSKTGTATSTSLSRASLRITSGGGVRRCLQFLGQHLTHAGQPVLHEDFEGLERQIADPAFRIFR